MEYKQKQMSLTVYKIANESERKKSSIREITNSGTRVLLYKDPEHRSIENIPLRFQKENYAYIYKMPHHLVCFPDSTRIWFLGRGVY